jgi:peptidoglycan/LPS O-acetylase OafA/YrhL
MTKQESLMMKGVAILLMLFLHLFNHADVVASRCINFCHVQGLPLANWLSHAANPVSYYLFLGGFGLAIVNRGGRDVNKYKRIARLFITYWLSILIFVTIGHFVNSAKYPGSITTIIANATGYDTSYNGEMWFLLPYVVLSLFAPFLFKLFDRYKTRYILAVIYFMSLCTSFVISRYGEQYLYPNRWIYNPFLVFHLMFPFMLGAACVRHDFFEKLKEYSHKHKLLQKLSYLLVALIIVFRCSVKIRFTGAFLMLAIISLILIAPKPKSAVKALSFLGKYSTGMWMVHTYFCIYLFRDFIYGAKYPILIYILLIAVSLFSAIIIQKLSAKISSTLNI